MLTIENIVTNYGKIRALDGISLSVGDREIVTLIGANGAGKTTTLKTMAGAIHPQAGRITWDGQDITRTPAHRIVPLGVTLVPEGRRIFPELTVLENLEMGAYTRAAHEIRSDLEHVFSLLPLLADRRAQLGGTLSGGEQQMLAIARALMSRPRLMLLDEPSVEQNAHLALRTATRGYVIETGRIVIADASDALLKNEKVRHAYLGSGNT